MKVDIIGDAITRIQERHDGPLNININVYYSSRVRITTSPKNAITQEILVSYPSFTLQQRIEFGILELEREQFKRLGFIEPYPKEDILRKAIKKEVSK